MGHKNKYSCKNILQNFDFSKLMQSAKIMTNHPQVQSGERIVKSLEKCKVDIGYVL